MKACFFSNVADPYLLELMEWYKQDILLLRNLGFDLNIATQLSDIAWDNDIYFSWWCTGSILPLLIAKLRRKPIVILGYGSEVVNSIPNLGYNKLPVLKKIIVCACLKFSDLTLSISESIRIEASQLIKNNYPVVYLVLDTEHFSPNQNVVPSGHILTISHLNQPNVERKALAEIIKAIPQIISLNSDQVFVLAGSKLDAYPHLEKLAHSLGIRENILFPGRISDDEKLCLLQGAKLYLQPTYHEGFGMAIAEAMSCGIPVVTSCVGSVPEITGGNCFYVDPDKPRSIASAVNLILDEEQEDTVQHLILEGREWVIKRFSPEQRKQKIMELLIQKWPYIQWPWM